MVDKLNALSQLKARKAKLTEEMRVSEWHLNDEPFKDCKDRPTERQNDEVLDAIGTHNLSEPEQIEAAIQRNHKGTYGIRIKCGASIDVRLRKP